MKKLLFLALGLLSASVSFAQQRPQYSQYMMNNFLMNPAVTGIEDYIDVRTGYRRQWLGVTNSPSTFYASAHVALNKNDKNIRQAYGSRKTFVSKSSPHANKNNHFFKARPHHGVGIIAQSDKTGPLSTTLMSGNYAYHIPLSRTVKFSSGVSVGMLQYFFDPMKATLYTANDPAFMDGRTNSVNVDLGLGTWLYSDKFFIGASAQQLIPNQDDVSRRGYRNDEGPLQRHYYVTGGYKLEVAHNVDVVPSVMVKMAAPSPVAVDVNARIIYAQRLWAGVSYRHQDAVAAMVGMNVSPLLDIGYSYDATTSAMRKVSAGSHEVMVGLKLINRNGVLCPQWMW
ncbi:MAG: type IX secretion system membrane protein PorP/SprF [Hymenobacteraceae bacterium]|nr:type IX secretion system membrane protein PorP/SprF [Hymenobacteraceae bacterium]MDX5398020.1 type IX secretion system membrane protein PorP/SprF [Hymenobacteraceae bacterium]MDX5514091.1 type IX secretion system membrane protein PorP/SprF [Hymenobacteraceae bacterium]